jgi:uncharacterized LabA/DUF88 family protein
VTESRSQLGDWARRLEATADGQPLRAGIFVDEAYLYCVLRDEFHGARFPWRLTPSILAPGFRTVATNVYTTPPADAEERTGFETFRKIIEQENGYSLRLGVLVPSKAPGKRYEQKQVDVMLAVDMVLLVSESRADVVVLVAGDQDFVPAVKAVRERGAYVVLWHGPDAWTSGELKKACDENHRLTHNEIQVI